MDWREIILKDMQRNRNRNKQQVRLAGGNPQDSDKSSKGGKGNIMDMEEDRLEREELANATREDLIDKLMDMVGSMSDDQLIDILMTSQGEVGLMGIDIEDRR